MSNKKVLITGATGFIGSHLTEHCVEQGYNVKAFDRYNPNNHWGWLENSNYKSEIEVVLGDIRDYDSVYNSMKGCDIVFHLAALIGIPYSYISPLAYIRTNIEGTYNILEAGRQLRLDNILITSTSETYGTAQCVPIDENHPMIGQSPYAASKIAADQIALSYYRSFGIPVVIARPFNTYGPRQSARAVIPTIITQLLNGNKNIQLGSIHPTRDFNYVGDVCKGLINLSKCDEAIGREVNIGSGTEISIGSLAKLLIELTGTKVEISSDGIRIRPDKSEVERLVCDNRLIKEITGWEPQTTLREGLLNTIEWFKDKENLKRYKDDIYNI